MKLSMNQLGIIINPVINVSIIFWIDWKLKHNISKVQIIQS